MSIPFALSIHNFIHSVGADCGFAAIIGLALVVILFFAHARETANLRDGLDDSYERMESLEQQLNQLGYQQQVAARNAALAQATPVGGPPIAPRPGGVPARSSAAASALTTAVLPAAALGLGAPSLGSATKLITDPVPQPVVPGQTLVGASALAAASGGATAVAPAPAFPATGQLDPAQRVQLRPNGNGAAGTLVGSGSSGPASAGGAPASGGYVPSGRRSLLEDEPPRRRGLLWAVLALIVVAIIVVVAIVALSGGGNAKTGTSVSTTNTKTKAAKTAKAKKFVAADYRVAVLNGTAVSGLAADVFNVIGAKGFKKSSITNAATQTETQTLVYYVNKSDETAAAQVAKALSLPASRVEKATTASLQSCATSPTGASIKCTASVIVSVGSDKQSLASAGTQTVG